VVSFLALLAGDCFQFLSIQTRVKPIWSMSMNPSFVKRTFAGAQNALTAKSTVKKVKIVLVITLPVFGYL
jgi:hypothetical protein